MKGLERLSIFKSAYQTYHSGSIRLESRTERALYYVVQDINSGEEHSVIVSLDPESRVIKLQCDCTNASLLSKHLPLCSHMMTTIICSVFTLGRPKRK